MAIANSAHVFETLMSKQDFLEVEKRIKSIAAQNELARMVVTRMTSNLRARAERPTVKGLPLLGSALRLSEDARLFIIEQYKIHGPVFRVKVLNREYTVLAGVEANNFVQRHGRNSFDPKKPGWISIAS